MYHQERWGLTPLEHLLLFFDLGDDIVWGATATMLRNLLVLITSVITS